jgi:hypothetical protein
VRVPTAERLLLLYPRAWRERYGEEFVATVGPDRLHPQQIIDIVSGAIDAWLSSDVQEATRTLGVARNGEGSMVVKSRWLCDQTKMRVSTRDSLTGAAVMIAGSVIFSGLGIAARRDGWAMSADALLSIAFPGSLALSMPFWLMKGQPWKAQVAIVGGTFALLIAISYLASAIG